jgi:hypothetical protein
MSNQRLEFDAETVVGMQGTQATPTSPVQRPSLASIAKVSRPENETNLSLNMQMLFGAQGPENLCSIG